MKGEPHFHKNGVYQWKKNENPFIASSFIFKFNALQTLNTHKKEF